MAADRPIGAARDVAGRFAGGERHWNWKGDKALDHSKRLRARRWYALPASCEECGATDRKIERHHADANPGNNEPSNIRFVCRSCHQRLDGRAAQAIQRLAAHNVPQEAKPCSNCGRSYKPLRHSRCPVCARHWRNTGAEFDTSKLRKHDLIGSSRWVDG